MSLTEVDTAVFVFINRDLQNPFFDVVMPFVTSYAYTLFLPVVLLLAVREKKNILPVLILGLISVALADACSTILKEIVMRQRPFDVLDNVHLLAGRGRSYSMPSNHASNAFAFSMTMWLMLRGRVSSLLIAAAAVIAFSRISVGVHYPSDVLAGACLGFVIAYATRRLYLWARAIYLVKSYEQALHLALMLISFFRIWFIMTGPFDLTLDEAHYWEWSRRPDWSYYSKGPAIAWMIRVGTMVFGDTVLGIRVFAVVLSALSSIILFRLGRGLFDEKTGLASALLMQAVPLFSVFGVLFTIDSPFIFFWLLSLYLFHRVTQKDKAPLVLWALLGISAGAGLLTKYTMAFFLFSGFLYLIVCKDVRPLLKTPGPYLAIMISVVLFTPVIVWNASNDWVTLKHTAGQAHVHEGLVVSLRTFGEFLGSQFGVMTPLLFVASFLALARLKTSPQGSFLIWFSLPIIGFFLLKSLQGKVQANWALPGYIPVLIAFSSVFISRWKNLGRVSRIATIASILLALLVTGYAHFPSIIGLPDRLDPSSRLIGWRELGREASTRYRALRQQGPAFVFSDSYQVASELAFYMEGNPVTYCANLGRRMNQYDLWPGFEGLEGQNALFVRTKEKGLPGEVGDAFRTCDQEFVTVETRRKKTVKFTIFACYDFKGFQTQPIERF